MFKKKIALLFVLLSMLLGGVATYIIIYNYNSSKDKRIAQQKNVYTDPESDSNYNVVRLNGYFHYIKPILYVERRRESIKYSSLKTNINALIEKYKIDGSLYTASVYLRDLKNGDWMELNPTDSFQPGSLLKVCILITFLRMNEHDPNILNSFVIYDKLDNINIKQNIISKTITPGQKYRVNELLHFMIANSDNYAMSLLYKCMDTNIYNNVYTDLGLSIKNINNRENFVLTAKQYSLFFTVLYNATYLCNDNSEYAATLLSKSDFKDGLMKQLPKNLKVAHKFGEAGTVDTPELSESGIIYLSGNPYLITVMTKGRQLNKLSTIISEISKMVYDKMVEEN